MQRLVWFETALIFGALMPLLLPLLALQLYMDAHIFDWLLCWAPSSRGETARLPVQRRAMQYHVVLVLALHCAMAAFFFVDGQLFGRWTLVVILSVVWASFVCAKITGVRLGDALCMRWVSGFAAGGAMLLGLWLVAPLLFPSSDAWFG